MLIVQNISKALTPWTHATTKVAGKEIGLELGKVEIFVRGDTLFYTQDHQLKLSTGFERLESRKVFLTQNRAQISFPKKWFATYCAGTTNIKVFYTDLGLFVKPFYGDSHV